jgi:hypothetical protein
MRIENFAMVTEIIQKQSGVGQMLKRLLQSRYVRWLINNYCFSKRLHKAER